MKAMRVCKQCGLEAHKEEDLSLFVKNAKSKYGVANLCVKCKSKANNYIPNKYGPTKEKYEQYKATSREKYKSLSPEDKKLLLEANRERYYANHEFYRKNKNAKARENREYYAEKCRKRRASIISSSDGTITLEFLENLKQKQNCKCFYCECDLNFDIKQSVHLDHVIPLSNGGVHSSTNVVWSCVDCNLKKGAKLI